MFKYIYSGDVPEDPKSLTQDLLQIADMYLLIPIVEACLKHLVNSLDVSSCISTVMLVDRYYSITFWSQFALFKKLLGQNQKGRVPQI